MADLNLPESAIPGLNWLFLVECITVVTLATFYLFYLNRLMGLLVAFILRLYIGKSTNSYFEIGSIQLSLLGGRVLVKNVRYTSRNESIRISHGSVTWRYWFWRVRASDDLQKENTARPCRIIAQFEGVEWFIYNRTISYDSILEKFGYAQRRPPSRFDDKASTTSKLRSRSDSTSEEQTNSSQKEQGIDWLFEALPIDIRVNKGSIVVGNNATPMIIVAGFSEVSGTYGAVESRSKLDYYKQIAQLHFVNPKVVFRTNQDYVQPMVQHGEHVVTRLSEEEVFEQQAQEGNWLSIADFHVFRAKLVNFSKKGLKRLFSDLARGSDKGKPWEGLARYRDNTSDAGYPLDYAKVATLLDAPSLDLTYYADAAGKVPSNAEPLTKQAGLETLELGNSGSSPEWGVDLAIHGGTINYGPWTDSQRAIFQNIFFPPSFFDNEQTPMLKAGDIRLHTGMKVFITFTSSTTLRLPTREPSNDWKYDADGKDNSSIIDGARRPFGWIDLEVGPDSSINVVVPMVTGPQGYETLLEIHIVNLLISTSVNYAHMLKARTCHVSAQMPVPLGWDEARTWFFDITLSKGPEDTHSEVILLRDHVNLLTDMVSDFLSGPSASYELFVPVSYSIKIALVDLCLTLFLNEGNIINNPTEKSDNTLLLLKAPKTSVDLQIPSQVFQQAISQVSFHVETHDAALSMTVPAWNTLAAFATERTTEFGKMQTAIISGSYLSYNEIHPGNVEVLDLNVELERTVFKPLGWTIRQLLSLKDVYFGMFTHFLTLEEYRHKTSLGLIGDPVKQKHRPGTKNPYQVNLKLSAKDLIAVMSQEVYDCKKGAILSVAHLDVDLRNHDYFMEMDLDIGQLRGHITDDCERFISPVPRFDLSYITTDYIDLSGVQIEANRLFGPKPLTATYLCIWEIWLGDLQTDLTLDGVRGLAAVVRSFAYNYVDDDNAMPPEFQLPVDPDMTFVSVKSQLIEARVACPGQAIVHFKADELSLSFDDMPYAIYLDHISVCLPTLSLCILAPDEDNRAPWVELASVHTALMVSLGSTKADREDRVERQRGYVQEQDEPTQRCVFLYGDESERRRSPYHAKLSKFFDVSTLDDNESIISTGSSSASESTRRLPELQRNKRLSTTLYRASRFSSLSSAWSSAPYVRLLRRYSPAVSHSGHQTFHRSSGIAPPHPQLNQRRISYQKAALPATFASSQGEPPYGSKNHIHLEFAPTVASFSPLAVGPICQIFASKGADQNLELMLDDLLLTYVALHSPGLKKSSSAEIKLDFPSLEVRALQEIVRPNGNLLDGDTELERIGSVLTFRLKQSSFTYSAATEYAYAEAVDMRDTSPTYQSMGAGFAFDQLHIDLCHSSEAIEAQRSASRTDKVTDQAQPEITIDMPASHLGGGISNDKISATGYLADLTITFLDTAPEVLTGSAYCWFGVIEEGTNLLAKKSLATARYRQAAITSILELANSAGIGTDPIFLNRVSFLVQTSRHNLRSDVSWKVLARLRHCLRLLSASAVRQSINGLKNDPRVTPKAMYTRSCNLLAEWRAWEIDSRTADHLDVFGKLFGAERSPTAAETNDLMRLVSSLETNIDITTGILRVILMTGEDTTANDLYIGPVSCQLRSNGTLVNSVSHPIVRLRIEDVRVSVDPLLGAIVKHIALVRDLYEDEFDPQSQLANSSEPVAVDSSESLDQQDSLHLHIFFMLDRFTIGSQGRGVVLESAVQNLLLAATLPMPASLQREHGLQVGPILASFDRVAVSAAEISDKPRSILGLVELNGFRLHGKALASASSSTSNANGLPSPINVTIDVVGNLERFRLAMPRSLLRMHKFMDQWYANSLPRTRFMLQELRRDLELPRTRAQRMSSAQSLPKTTRTRVFLWTPRIQFLLKESVVQVRAARALRADYTLDNVLLFGKHLPSLPGSDAKIEGALEIRGQTLQFIPMGHGSKELGEGEKVSLPAMRIQAQKIGRKISLFASVDVIAVTITAAIMDNIFAVQNRFGQDYDDLLDIVMKYSTKGRSKASSSPNKSKSPATPLWDARLTLHGFNISLKGPNSTQHIEGHNISASIIPAKNRATHEWSVFSTSLSLSLLQHSKTTSRSKAKSYRLASFTLGGMVVGSHLHLEEQLPGSPAAPPTTGAFDRVQVHFPRLHAVLQPAALISLADLVDYYITEIGRRKQERSEELAQIKNRVKQTLQLSDLPSKASQGPSWFERCDVTVVAKSIGFAIPLADEEIEEMKLERPLNRKSTGRISDTPTLRPALLASIPSLRFVAQPGMTGSFAAEEFSIQFVNQFDPTQDLHFSRRTHSTHNALLLPQTRFSIQPARPSATISAATHIRRMQVHAECAELDVQLDPTIVPLGFLLADMLQLSQQRVQKLAQGAFQPTSEDSIDMDASQSFEAAISPVPSPTKTKPKVIQATFDFRGGKIMLFPKAESENSTLELKLAGKSHRRRHSLLNEKKPARRGSISSEIETPADVIVFPRIQVEAEYRGADDYAAWRLGSTEQSNLQIGVVIRTSQNILRPSLLPIISGFSDEMKKRVHESDAVTTMPTPHRPQPAAVSEFVAPDAIAQLKLAISLRIESSELQITCQPTAPVSAALKWQGGGFLLTLTPGVKGLSFVARVEEVSVDLRHAFSPEACVAGRASSLVALINVSEGDESADVRQPVLSIILQISSAHGEVNIRQLQDWLSLKSVWLDRLDELGPSSATAVVTSAQQDASANQDSTSHRDAEESSSPHQGLVNISMVQLDRVSFLCTGGPTVGRLSLQAINSFARLRMVPGQSRTLNVNLEKLEATLSGRISGTCNVTHSSFETVLQTAGLHDSKLSLRHTELVSIRMIVGHAEASLEAEYRKLLLFRSDPMHIVVKDDWSSVTADDAERKLVLVFSVKLGTILLLGTSHTAPTLLRYAKDVRRLLDDARTKAQSMVPLREIHTLSKGNAMHNTAASFAPASAPDQDSTDTDPSSFRLQVVSLLHFETESIQIIAFPNHFSDQDLFRLDTGRLDARLSSDKDESGRHHRKLSLYSDVAQIRRVQSSRITTTREKELELHEWMELLDASRKTVVILLPQTTAQMESWESEGRIEHNSIVKYGGASQSTLNFGVGKAAQELAKLYESSFKKALADYDHPPPRPDHPLQAEEIPSDNIAKEEQPETASKEASHEHYSSNTVTMPAISSAKGGRKLTFVGKDVHIDKPQYNLLGEATPALLQMVGYAHEKVPIFIHTCVTAPLEEVLEVLSSRYEEQLKRRLE